VFRNVTVLTLRVLELLDKVVGSSLFWLGIQSPALFGGCVLYEEQMKQTRKRAKTHSAYII